MKVPDKKSAYKHSFSSMTCMLRSNPRLIFIMLPLLCLVLVNCPTQAQSRAKLQQAPSKPAFSGASNPQVKVVEKVVYRDRPAAKTKVVYRDRPAAKTEVVYRDRTATVPEAAAADTAVSKAVWNDPKKIYELGGQYVTGLAGPVDYTKALRCYRRAAELGSVEGIFIVGLYYHLGQGVPQDDAQAVVWYKRGAALGYTPAMIKLGQMYSSGEGVIEDKCLALQCFKSAAEAGSAKGMYLLGHYYRSNRCAGTKDKALFREWMQRTVQAGSHPSASSEDKVYAEDAAKELKDLDKY